MYLNAIPRDIRQLIECYVPPIPGVVGAMHAPIAKELNARPICICADLRNDEIFIGTDNGILALRNPPHRFGVTQSYVNITIDYFRNRLLAIRNSGFLECRDLRTHIITGLITHERIQIIVTLPNGSGYAVLIMGFGLAIITADGQRLYDNFPPVQTFDYASVCPYSGDVFLFKNGRARCLCITKKRIYATKFGTKAFAREFDGASNLIERRQYDRFAIKMTARG